MLAIHLCKLHRALSPIHRSSLCRLYTATSLANKETDERKLKVSRLELEYKLCTRDNFFLQPDLVTADQWDHMLTLTTATQRDKFYNYLNRRYKRTGSRKRRDKKRKLSKQQQVETRQAASNCNHLVYGLDHNSLYKNIRHQSVVKWQTKKLIGASFYGPKVLIDCGYDGNMNYLERVSAGRKIFLSILHTRKHRFPFNLQLYNLDFDGSTFGMMKQCMPALRERKLPPRMKETCFTVDHAEENLVYLSPDSDHVLSEYNPSHIYIIGAVVENGACVPLSRTKAEALGIRHARLPLSPHERHALGAGKGLDITTTLDILLSWRDTNDWKKVIDHITARKLKEKSICFQQRKENL